MSIRERTVEIGTLRAVGYGRGRVLGLVLTEAIAVAVARRRARGARRLCGASRAA